MRLRWWLLISALGALGCDISYGEPPVPSGLGVPILSPAASLPSEACPDGGTQLNWGVDSDGDGALGAAEVQDTFIMCSARVSGRDEELWEAFRGLAEEAAGHLDVETDPHFALSPAAALSVEDVTRWQALPEINHLATAVGMAPGEDCGEGMVAVIRGGLWTCAPEANATVQCSGCISRTHLDFEAVSQAELQTVWDSVPAAVDGLEGGLLTSDTTVNGQLAANAILQQGNPVCDASGNCELTSLTGGRMEIFGTATFSRSALPLPSDLVVEIPLDVPSLGAISGLEVHLQLREVDVSALMVELEAPDGAVYLLYDASDTGSELLANYPAPTLPVSGDLADWVGREPEGTWALRLMRTATSLSGRPSELTEWSLRFTEATGYGANVRVLGHLEVSGELRGALVPDFDSRWLPVDTAVATVLAIPHNLGEPPARVSIQWSSTNPPVEVVEVPSTVSGERSLVMDSQSMEVRFADNAPVVGWLESGVWQERASGYYRIRMWR